MANKVILTGRLGADPVIHEFDDGTLANVRLASSERFRDKASGEMRELTDWHNVAFNGSLGTIARDRLQKGTHIYIEGRLRTRKWQAQDGSDRYTTEVAAQRLEILGGAKSAPADGSGSADLPASADGAHDDWVQSYDGASTA